jgi:DNA-binding LacI/PurR family transcriptional regulator
MAFEDVDGYARHPHETTTRRDAGNYADDVREAEVSVATVSHVMNGARHVEAATAGRVVTAADRLGYRGNRLARALARGDCSDCVGPLVPMQRHPALGSFVVGVSAAPAARDWGVLLADIAYPGEDPRASTACFSCNPDRLPIVCESASAQAYQRIEAIHRPAVFFVPGGGQRLGERV